jgi:hypothetical protein
MKSWSVRSRIIGGFAAVIAIMIALSATMMTITAAKPPMIRDLTDQDFMSGRQREARDPALEPA